MEYKYHDLKEKTLAELKEIASKIEHEAVKGYTQLNKEHLLSAICKALNIEEREKHEVVGINKQALKSAIKKLKLKRDQALKDDKKKDYKDAVEQITRLKHKLRKSTV
jgi:hypothetical protein